MTHIPVFLKESTESLVLNSQGVYLDATFGRGGHSQKILSKLSGKGRLIAIDKDPEAVEVGKSIEHKDPRFKIIHADFADFADELSQLGITSIHGALFDLGVSSNQLDEANRGFSFQADGPLDMRMDNSQGETLEQWLDNADEQQIFRVLKDYGEESFARSIARAIVRNKPIKSTLELAAIIASARPYSKKHPATKSFQALRICLNRELEALSKALDDVIDLLATNGRLVVISFHSLEDRIVKQRIAKNLGQRPPASIPSMDWIVEPTLKSLGKHKPSTKETEFNARARSAILRVAEKLPRAA